MLCHTSADLFPGRKRAGAEVELGHGGLVGGSELGRDVAGRVEGRARGKAAGRANLDAVASEEGAVDLLDAAHHLVGLVSVGEEVEHLAVAQELVDVVEVPAATPVDRPVGVRGELAGTGRG